MPTIYLPVCDQNLWVIELYAKFADKYTPELEVVVLGFSPPDFELPKNMKFVSMAPKQIGGASKWTRYIHDYMKTLNEEYIMFSMEDMFPVCKIDWKTIGLMIEMMNEDREIGRFDLTWDTFCNCGFKKYGVEKINGSDVNIIEIGKNQLYRVSTQPSIWRLDFFLKLMDHDWSPWDFEVIGSKLSQGMDYKVLSIADPYFKQYPTKWIPKGAVSRYHEGSINILGMPTEDIREFVHRGILTEDTLQWGQWEGPVPRFKDLGGYDFHPSRMPRHAASPTEWKEWWPTYVDNKPVRHKL